MAAAHIYTLMIIHRAHMGEIEYWDDMRGLEIYEDTDDSQILDTVVGTPENALRTIAATLPDETWGVHDGKLSTGKWGDDRYEVFVIKEGDDLWVLELDAPELLEAWYNGLI